MEPDARINIGSRTSAAPASLPIFIPTASASIFRIHYKNPRSQLRSVFVNATVESSSRSDQHEFDAFPDVLAGRTSARLGLEP